MTATRTVRRVSLAAALACAASCCPAYLTNGGLIDYRTRHGIGVVENGWEVGQPAVEAAIDETLAAWRAKAPELGDPARALAGAHVVLRPLPFHRPCPVAACAGSIYYGRTVYVGVALPLSRSALAHELGHLIYRGLTGQEGEVAYQAFAKERGLP
jgi:hypothetical protein